MIEMSIRGIQSRETFSPVTVVLLAYLKYVGGETLNIIAL